jgi:hypothetical protein
LIREGKRLADRLPIPGLVEGIAIAVVEPSAEPAPARALGKSDPPPAASVAALADALRTQPVQYRTGKVRS